MTAYETVHTLLKNTRGPAKNYICRCGKSALDWALQYGHPERIVWEKPKPYSPNPDDYEPMCRGCHFVLDLEVGVRDRSLLDAAQLRNLAAAREVFQKRLERDQGYRQQMSEVRRQNARAARTRLKNRRCGDCPMVTMPGALGKHQKATGHRGWVAA